MASKKEIEEKKKEQTLAEERAAQGLIFEGPVSVGRLTQEEAEELPQAEGIAAPGD